jgi:DNA-binding MarR family transcriptional regulator
MDVPILTIEETQKLPGALLWRASKLWQNSMHSELTGLNLSSTNAIVLSNILRLELEGTKITQAGLADLCGVDRMTASTILRSLTDKGFVERKVYMTDKRSLELSLTDKGREVAYEALRRIAIVHQQFFETIDSTELSKLADSLFKLIEAKATETKEK